MKSKVTLLLAVFLLLCAGVIAVSCGESKPGSASEVKSTLEKVGFTVQEGKMGTVDIFAMVQAGILDNANYQNEGASYLVPKLPTAPGQQAPPTFTDAPIAPSDQGLFLDYRLAQDQAIILFGKTPPKCQYFGFDANVITRVSPTTGKPIKIFGNYGDPINFMTIKTDGPDDDPYERNTMIVMAADLGVASKIKEAVADSGYSPDIVNEYPVPSQLLRLGLDAKSDTMALLHRFAYPADQKAGDKYLADPTMNVFRVIPKETPTPDLYDMPGSLIRGAGEFRELEMSSTAEKLRQAILEKYQGFAAAEQTTSPWKGGSDGADGLTALQELTDMYGPGRDALYMRTTEFTLANSPDEFAIVYGINHAATSKATYSSLCVYNDQLKNGVASAWNGQWAKTADEFLPGDPNAKYFYVWKIARSSGSDPDTTTVPFNQGVYGIDLDLPMFVGFRNYVEPKTKTGPIATELYFDRVIKFGPKQ